MSGKSLRFFDTGVALENKIDECDADCVKVEFPLAGPFFDPSRLQIGIYGTCGVRWHVEQWICR
jgi:hypothetical protein